MTPEQMLQFGLSVIPCWRGTGSDRDKQPRIKWGRYQTERATSADIEQWQSRFGECNWAIVTGETSNVFVLDIDTPEGQRYAEEKGLPETVSVATAHGQHYYYKWPGFPVGNLGAKSKLGFDIRGDGGYVMAPDSIHPTGTIYEWKNSIEDVEIASAPEWLLDLVRPGQPRSSAAAVRRVSSTPAPHSATPDDDPIRTPEAVRSMLAALPWGRGRVRPGYDDWVRVIAAVRDAVGPAEAVGLLTAWSPEDAEGEYSEKLKAPLERVRFGTLRKLAEDAGWDVRQYLRSRPTGTTRSTTRTGQPAGVRAPQGESSSRGDATSDTQLVRAYQPRQVDNRSPGLPDTPHPAADAGENGRYPQQTDHLPTIGETRGHAPSLTDHHVTEPAYEIFVPDWTNQPAEVPATLTLDGSRIGSRGNISLLIASPGSGKSAVCEAIVARRLNPHIDAFGLDVHSDRPVVYIDTERTQDDHWTSWYRMTRRAQFERGAMLPDSAVFELWALIPSIDERCDRLLSLLSTGTVGILIVDGITDFVKDVNDAEECNTFLTSMRALAMSAGTSLLFTIHGNPGMSQEKARGHLGSELLRRSESVLFLKVDAATRQRTLTTNFSHGKVRNATDHLEAHFAWDDDRKMFLSCEDGRSSSSAGEQENLRALAEGVFPETGGIRYEQVVRGIMAATGKGETTAKKRLWKMQEANLIVRFPDGEWRINRNEIPEPPDAQPF